MRSVERRVARIEGKLKVRHEPVTVHIAYFGDDELPPDNGQGVFVCKYVRYKDARNAEQAQIQRENTL
ncbi:MAG TPA: hypothetical protein VMW16_08050 [Sedimentisphaerales bacterium]|nr:hypothetical protein [Sedimentisphaerales bacterium]